MSTNNSGSLIQLHHHDNFDVLNNLTDIDGVLYYQGAPITISISNRANNGIALESDGLYMSNLTTLTANQYNLVSRFSYVNGSLLFDGTIVSQEYDDSQIQMMITDLWNDLEPGGDTSDITES